MCTSTQMLKARSGFGARSAVFKAVLIPVSSSALRASEFDSPGWGLGSCIFDLLARGLWLLNFVLNSCWLSLLVPTWVTDMFPHAEAGAKMTPRSCGHGSVFRVDVQGWIGGWVLSHSGGHHFSHSRATVLRGTVLFENILGIHLFAVNTNVICSYFGNPSTFYLTYRH